MYPLPQERIKLNDNWGFRRRFVKGMCDREFDWKKLELVRLPHWGELQSYPAKEKTGRMCCGYRKEFSLGVAFSSFPAWLVVHRPSPLFTIYLNGVELSLPKEYETSWEIPVSGMLSYTVPNVLTVVVDNRDEKTSLFAGLSTEMELRLRPVRYLREAKPLVDFATKTVTTHILVEGMAQGLSVRQRLLSPDQNGRMQIVVEKQDLTQQETTISFSLPDAVEWNPSHPVCYTVKTELFEGAKRLESVEEKVGFCSKEFSDDTFFLNGKSTRLMSVVWNGLYPFVGMAMPSKVRCREAEEILRWSGCNAVLPAGTPVEEAFLTTCDEKGLMVLLTKEPQKSHPCALVPPKGMLDQLTAQFAAFSTREESPAFLLNEAYEKAGSVGVLPFAFTDGYPLTNKKNLGGDGVLTLFRQETSRSALCRVQGQIDTPDPPFERLSWEKERGGTLPVCYTKATSGIFTADDVNVGPIFPDTDRFGSLPHPPIVPLYFREWLAGIFDDRDEEVGKEIVEWIFLLQEKGESGLSIPERLRFQHFCKKNNLLKAHFRIWQEKMQVNLQEDLRILTVTLSSGEGEPQRTLTWKKFPVASIHANADTLVLHEDGTFDCALVRLQVVEEGGALLFVGSDRFRVETEGRIQILGTVPRRLQDGAAAFLVTSTGESGEGEVRVLDKDDSLITTIHFSILEGETALS